MPENLRIWWWNLYKQTASRWRSRTPHLSFLAISEYHFPIIFFNYIPRWSVSNYRSQPGVTRLGPQAIGKVQWTLHSTDVSLKQKTEEYLSYRFAADKTWCSGQLITCCRLPTADYQRFEKRGFISIRMAFVHCSAYTSTSICASTLRDPTNSYINSKSPEKPFRCCPIKISLRFVLYIVN